MSLDAMQLTNMLPILLVALFAYGFVELGITHFRQRKANLREYGMFLKGLGFTGLIGVLVAVVVGPLGQVSLALWGDSLSPFDAGLSPLAWAYGFFVYEMCYWLQHWVAHNTRLFWCMHSPHHAPESMNMFVGFNHSFLESLFYMPVALGFLPALLGVHPAVIAVLMLVDVVWGNLLHLSNHVVERPWGWLERFMQTPSHHRVHHARNVRYLDTNYNSISLLGDWLMGTLQRLDEREPVEFGITRTVDTASFVDVHFGEFGLLWRDLKSARNLREVVSYLFRPPGWTPDGEQHTAAARKRRALQQQGGERDAAATRKPSCARLPTL